MPKRPQRTAIRRHRFERAISTETFPAETPVIFSNSGFVDRCMDREKAGDIEAFLIRTIVTDVRESPEYTKPLKYRIRKSSSDFRTLSLIHPSSQWRMAEFYREYDGQICHFCTQSSFSIRHPSAVANAVYLRTSTIRDAGNEASENDGKSQETIGLTYFFYAGYDRLYRFFNSKRLVDLEARFPTLMKVDIAKCFDSIYTHSITWATRSKVYAKANTRIRTFANDFDVLMQKSNYNETNGIPIGPEISRIFAEVIFQDIDRKVEAKLVAVGNVAGSDYQVARYVDDIFIFAKNDDVSTIVLETYMDELSSYNLHTNSAKTELLHRPFFTRKSKVIRDVNGCINAFVDAFLDSSRDRKFLIPKRIYHRDKLVRSFVDAVKSSCTHNSVPYDDVTPYIVSALLQRTQKTLSAPSAVIAEQNEFYFDAFVAVVEASFFFYTVAPSVSSSYHLCRLIILIIGFVKANLSDDIPSLKQLMHDGCLRLFEGNWAHLRSEVSGFVFLEAINVALSTCGHGSDFMLPEARLRSIFGQLRNADYFQLTSLLFYCKDDLRYVGLKNEAISEIDKRMRILEPVLHDSGLAHLLLDAITCPHIPAKSREKWLRRLYKITATPVPTSVELRAYLRDAPARPWFVDWLETDLLASLSKKRLLQVYA